MKLITPDDFIELYFKIKQRGLPFILSKINPSDIERTKSTFNDSYIESSNWWIIPRIRERWNEIISNQKDIGYEQYVTEKYLSGKTELTMLSLGCGTGSHEVTFAKFDKFKKVIGIDISGDAIKAAKKRTEDNNLKNILFQQSNVNQMSLEEGNYDVILFHSSLHHFKNLENLIKDKVIPALKTDGLLILNDYWGPNRLMPSKKQLTSINHLLANSIPDSYKTRFKSKAVKRKVYGPGWLRMVISDPSEAAESSSIKPLLRKYFLVEEEKKIGGNILMLLLKDIAHHFLNKDALTENILEKLFVAEDELLKEEESLLFFGVYQLNSLSRDIKR